MSNVTLDAEQTIIQPGLRERQRQARDEAILQSAFALITERGYDALTMEELAMRVGISRQTLYHHFPSKDDIALRAVLTLMEQGIRSIREIDPALPPIARLERVVRWMLEMRFSPATAAFVRARLTLSLIRARPEYQTTFAKRAEAIAEIVRAAQEVREVRADVSSELIVQMLLGLVCDARYEDLVGDSMASPTEVTEGVVSVFFDGLRPQGSGG